jgi:[protein-PII] uridylyltransferase
MPTETATRSKRSPTTARPSGDGLNTALAALEAEHGGDTAALRAGLVALLRETHTRGLAHAHERLLADRDGLACAHRLSATMDRMIEATFQIVTRHIHPPPASAKAERLAVVAVGGYGRGTMAPGSDVDLLFILGPGSRTWSERAVETMLYVLWDLKLKVGHATRTIDESMREARGDLTIRTTLLEARHLTGDRALFDELVQRFEREVVAGTAASFVAAKLAERDARLHRAGTSRYVVEPNVKDGKGGLRDLNTLFWIAKYVYHVRDPKELVAAGLFTTDEFALFHRCESFLWRVRCHMHFETGRAEERLSFDLQRTIAERNGYVAHGGLSAVERFMKRYFLTAKDVGDLTAIVCAALEARHAKPRAVLDRFVGRLRVRRGSRKLASRDFTIDNNRITVADEGVFARDPVNLIRLFWLADRYSQAIHPDASRLATRSLKLIDRSLRDNPEANRLFLEILTSRNAPEVVLRRMNEAGVLGRFIPEFGRIVALMQFNMYHHYTVDEHLLRSVGVLADIDAGRTAEEHPLSHEIIGSIQNRRALYLALFLHDVAKGRQDDHSAAGARMARKLGPRFGLDEAETETAAWLVENHLVMSTVAQSRDIADPSTIRNFAGLVQTMERLKLLLVLTVCDIKAVGPGVWNGWKGELLRSLYYETQLALIGGQVSATRSERVRHAQAQLREALPDWSDEDFAAYAGRHYAPYWLKVDLARKIRHAALLQLAEKTGETTFTAVETDGFRGVTELIAVAPDHPRLLAILTGACAAAGGNIVDAQIFTTADGLALDTLVISRAFDRDDDELRRGERIARAIKRALIGEVRIADLVASRRPAQDRSRTFHVPTEVVVDNSLSDRQTVLEVSGLDRPGLLYDLTTVLGRLNLNIASAHIATYGEKVVDVFYVTDLTGAKIENTNRQAAIRRAIAEIFQPQSQAETAAISAR